jgi:hypothetical protein
MGVFITEGMGFRIPAGGLTLTADGQASLNLVEVSLDTHPYWIRVAMRNEIDSQLAHDQLLLAIEAEDEANKAGLLLAEFEASMVAVTSAAFSVDAFYASVKERAPVDQSVQDAWLSNGTARHKQIAETLRLSFELGDDVFEQMRVQLRDLYRFRDWAVHPPAEFRQPQMHRDIGSGVEWRFVAFTAENARAATNAAVRIVVHTLRRPRAKHAGLKDWAPGQVKRMEPIVKEWLQRYPQPESDDEPL